MVIKVIAKNLISMGLFASLAMGLVFWVFHNTQIEIEQSRAAFEKAILEEMSASLGASDNLNYIPLEQASSYLIMQADRRLGIIIPAITEDGYSGTIRLLVALHQDGEIIAIRVTDHHETPGLGDKIEAIKSPWSNQFSGRQLNQTIWEVKKWGGDFDALSGATISSRAVISAVENSLQQWQKTNE